MLIDLLKIKYKPAIPFNGLMLLGSNVLGVSKYIVIVCILSVKWAHRSSKLRGIRPEEERKENVKGRPS